MWVCPKCGREFKKANQGHYCGKAPKTVLEYIYLQPLEARPHLLKMMAALQDSVPCISERVSYGACHVIKREQNISPFLPVKIISAFMQGPKRLKSSPLS